MSTTTKIDVVCSRADSEGLKDYVKKLNSYIEQGYRFHISDLFEDLPRLRAGYPKFTMSLPGHSNEPVKPLEEHIQEVLSESWYKDKEAIEAFIAALEAAKTKAETQKLIEDIGIILPEDKTHPAAQRSYLIGQLKGYL